MGSGAPSSTSSADPLALRRYAAAAQSLDDELRRLAARLTGRPEVPLDVAADLADLVAAEEATTRWVGAVATAFERTDAGSWTEVLVVSALAELSGRSADPDGAAEVLLGLAGLDAGPGVMAGAAQALGPEGVDLLVRTHPELVGPVEGMPVAARLAANRRLIAAAVADEADPVRRRHLQALLGRDPSTGRPRQILLFDPTGDCHVAEVFGDLDTARHVTVVVPGMGTDLDSFDRTVARRSADLAVRAGRVADEDGVVGSVAVVAWLGYDPPDGWSHDLGELGAAAGPQRAVDGGLRLAAFLEGLPSVSGQTRTLVGHSYGSTTVVAAVQAGADVDDVVVMGSPGVLVDHAEELDRPDTDFFVLAARRDVVADLGWFGPSPSRPHSGFTPLATDGSGHSSYFVDGSRSQANVVAVIVQRDDLLAPG